MKKVFALLLLTVFVTSCSTSRLMREPNVRVNLEKNDFTLSEQVTGEAKSLKVLGIDWKRLFKKTSGDVSRDGSASLSMAKIPVIGSFLADRTSNYALYEMMNSNPGYDVVIYPQYEVVKKNYIIFSKTTAKVTARLGKLKTE
jgi:hypothetical protein